MHETKLDEPSPSALEESNSGADRPQVSSDPAPLSGSNAAVESDTMADTSPATAEEPPQDTPAGDLPGSDGSAAGSQGDITDSPPRSDEVRNVDAELEECRRDGRGLARRLREAERRLERAAAEVAEFSARAARHRELTAKRSAEIKVMRQECDAEKTRAEQEQRRSRVLRKENAQLQSVSEALKAKASRLGTANEALQSEIERLSAVTGLQLLTSPLALQWLTRQRERTRLKLPREIVVVGSGPLPRTDMERLLKKAGFLLRQPGDPSAALMVVGRDEWLVDDMEEQIAVRKDDGLKVFSQEMLVGALATRDDPFDSADRKTLLSFADGHEALTYLVEAGFEWPFITPRSIREALRRKIEVSAKESPLHKMGYVVGKIRGLPEKARRRILANAFTGKLPKVETAEYMAGWGTPGSRIRLRRMASHIAWLAHTRQNEDSMGTAVEHWESDLAWLHEEFYESWMRFRWPETYA